MEVRLKEFFQPGKFSSRAAWHKPRGTLVQGNFSPLYVVKAAQEEEKIWQKRNLKDYGDDSS